MTTSLIPTQVGDQIQLAQQLSASNLLPDQYRKQPANLLWAIQYAQALGVHPMTAVTGIAVINGRPTASAQLIGGLVRRAGHKLRVEASDTKATAVIVRADDPDFEFRAEWTIERAKKAGLGERGPWKQYPAAMLTARAITEVARMAAPEALFGIIYTAEELGADVSDDGQVVGHGATGGEVVVSIDDYQSRKDGTGRTRFDIEDDDSDVMSRLLSYEDGAAGGLLNVISNDTADADMSQPIARNQKTRIALLRRELGIDDDAYRKRLQSLYGVRSSTELTQAQAADLIEKLSAAKKRGQNETPIV